MSTTAMTREAHEIPTLIHLNGPTGVGKSTLAAALVRERHLALNLDIDELRVRLGQWESTDDSKRVARHLGFELARRHLHAGYDVVMPQLIVSVNVIHEIGAVARSARAEYCQVLLVASTEELVARLGVDGPHVEPHPRNLFDLDTLASQIAYTLEVVPELATADAASTVVDVGGLSAPQALAAVRVSLQDCPPVGRNN
jgi:hypothetical protein